MTFACRVFNLFRLKPNYKIKVTSEENSTDFICNKFALEIFIINAT